MEFRLIIFGFILGIGSVVSSSDIKSSLTFVIDDTFSMSEDIDGVKKSVKAIFDKVVNSASSQIEDFVLVTFNDPGNQLRTITKDRGDFKRALDRINVHGGGDCPEEAMAGIELALKNSRDGSSIYVYTDASAIDYKKYQAVEALSQRKGCQIVFVLTGICGTRKDPDYLAYVKLARATNGHIFHLEKTEIGEILKSVENAIENRKHVITSKTYPAGYGNTFDVPVDGDTKELVITVTGVSPRVSVTDSGGVKWPTTDITRLHEIAVVKVVGVKPDVYKVEVGSSSETHVMVSGSTSVHFKHGFSVFTPTAFTDVVPLPVPGEKSHLSIKLATEGGYVELSRVQILDMNDKVIMEQPLKLIDKSEQFYTTDSITTPSHMFKIAIIGYDADSKTYMKRISLTPVKPQYTPTTVTTKSPVVTIESGPQINPEYGKPLRLKCKVSGYPRPSVIWESDDKSAIFTHTELTVELPYNYVSLLDIQNVRKNATYTCRAVNRIGDAESTIQTNILTFFNVVALPVDTTIEYHKGGQIFCKVEASPPLAVFWYKGRKPLVLDENMELSADASVLTIHSMEPYMDDEYICEARHPVGRRVVPFRLTMGGVELPEIDKKSYHIIALKESNADIQCKVTKGTPKPEIHWMFKDATAKEFTRIEETSDTIHFDKVDAANAGTYRCTAENVVGRDYHEVELRVEYKPSISREFNSHVTVNEGYAVTLTCEADGFPAPRVTWKHNGALISPRSHRHTIYKNGNLKFFATKTDEGVYECKATNVHGVDDINVNLNVIVPTEIESPKKSFIEQKVGLPVALPCRADGSPKPMITWIFRSKTTGFGPRELGPSDPSGELRFERIQQWQSGEYTCNATNPGGSKAITYEVSVLAPPSIRYTTREFRGVVDDMQLRIPCDVTGYPKPDITWSMNEYKLPLGSEWYDIGEDCSLFIKNLNEYSKGAYKCTASNKLGHDQQVFNVNVDKYPDIGFLSSSIMLERETSSIIPCSIPQRKTDRVRWFKDGRMLSSSDPELQLHDVRQSDAGTYTCRVSFADRPAQSGFTKVDVGFKPRFAYNDYTNIPFVKDDVVLMDCTATGQPEPEVTWFHDGKKLEFTNFNYVLEMNSASDRGRYTCYVRNRLGTVQREFVVSAFDCMLNIKNDFNENEPLMLTLSEELTNFDTSDEYVHIPKEESIKLVCPSGFNAFSLREIIVTCDNEQEFILQPSGKRYTYSELKCRDKFQPIVSTTGRRCSNGHSEMLKVGFNTSGGFKEVYQVCLDMDTKNPIYTKIYMQQPSFVTNNNTDWFNYGLSVDLDTLYDCNNQNSEISSILHEESHRYSGCCFARRMLVNPIDVGPGLPQASTYTHLNVVPHWGTCNSKNWKELEQRIRKLVLLAGRPLLVWTGTAQELQLPDARGEKKNVIFNSRKNVFQVPKYLWKVVQDPVTKASLAIIQVNVPDLKLVDARSHQLCKDVCRDVVWMQPGSNWRRKLNDGFTYCCSLEDFERAFRYSRVFPRYNNLLMDVSFIPGENYLHAI